jgi:type III pantothenate kinase
MKPDVFVDVGNTRVKWGRCLEGALADRASLPPDDPAAWQQQLAAWHLDGPLVWAVSGVHPARRDRLADWLRQRGDTVRVLALPEHLPLRVEVEQPERVGIDRLLNAVAANSRRKADTPAVVIDAGSAVTVDRVDRAGAFRGGAIFPGFRLMSQSLHDYTALLPLVAPPTQYPTVPATSTVTAIQAGIFHAVLGGILSLIQELTHHPNRKTVPHVFLTGGDQIPLVWPLKARLPDELFLDVWPDMTLEGVRLAAEALP